jgi:hypothetical protein
VDLGKKKSPNWNFDDSYPTECYCPGKGSPRQLMQWNNLIASFSTQRVCFRIAVFCALFILFAPANPAIKEASGNMPEANALGAAINFVDSDDLEITPGNDIRTMNASGRAVGNILFDLSHSPMTIQPMATHFSSFISALQSWGFTVTIASDFANLQNYSVVVFTFPQSSFTSAQVDRVRDYLDAGDIIFLEVFFCRS